MTDGFAAAVTVSIPIFALAAGAEARSVRDRLQRSDPEWERDFAQFRAEHELDADGSAAQVFDYFKECAEAVAAARVRARGGNRGRRNKAAGSCGGC